MRAGADGRKLCPPKPGSTLMTRIRSTAPIYGKTASTGVPGRMLMPTLQPVARMAAITSSTVSGTASRWKVIRLAPAAAKSGA